MPGYNDRQDDRQDYGDSNTAIDQFLCLPLMQVFKGNGWGTATVFFSVQFRSRRQIRGGNRRFYNVYFISILNVCIILQGRFRRGYGIYLFRSP